MPQANQTHHFAGRSERPKENSYHRQSVCGLLAGAADCARLRLSAGSETLWSHAQDRLTQADGYWLNALRDGGSITENPLRLS